jgi:hypothetical protein
MTTLLHVPRRALRGAAVGIIVLLCCIAVRSMPAAGQTISVGSTSGKKGWLVTVNTTLGTSQPVEGTQNDISFDNSKTPIAAKADGRPDCSVNASINKNGSFAFRPNGCLPGECSAVRAAVWTKDGFAPIPNGSTLYSCKVQIAADAPAGTYPLVNSNVGASNASGTALAATGTNGQVQVTGGCQIQPHGGGSPVHLAWLAAVCLAVRRQRRLHLRTPRRGPRHGTVAAGLSLVVLLAGLAPTGAYATTVVRSHGTWQSNDGGQSGQWEVELGMTALGNVHENVTYELHLAQSLPLVRQPQAFAAGFGGAGTTVAVLDTGLQPNALPPFDFGACGPENELIGAPGCSVLLVQDFAPDDGVLDDPGRHGTHVSGIVHAMAPNAGLIGLDVFTGSAAFFHHIAAAINWVIANRATYNIVAINMSLGTAQTFANICPTSALTEEISAALNAGVLSVIASGNSANPNGISDPACAPLAVRVGAVYDANVGQQPWGACTDPTTNADQVACFSNSAAFLTALAPGCRITVGNLTVCGTSQAAPHVTGGVALLRAPNAFPLDEPGCIAKRLTLPGVDIVDPRNGLEFPRLDAFGSVSTLPNSVCDCNGDGVVRIEELIRGVNIALGTQPLSSCPPADANGNGQVSISELVTGVKIMVTGCRVG